MQTFWHSPKIIKSQPLRIDIGELSLIISRREYEWRLNYEWLEKGSEGRYLCSYIDDIPDADLQIKAGVNGHNIDRVAMEDMTQQVTITPRLADRPVIVRPYSPLIIPADHRVTLYVTVPLWMCVNFSESVRRDFPVQRLSESWIGSLTGDGELCYGSYTHARLDKSTLPNLPYRALTVMTIHNQSNEDSVLQRLSIPEPYLCLYEVDGQLVTEPLSIAMDAKKNRGIVEIIERDGESAITAPRRQSDKGVLVNTWENLFS